MCASHGRNIVERLGLTGVAKLDFKRDMQGKLKLLEINPRFSLWHHAGAARRRQHSGTGLCRPDRLAAAGADPRESRRCAGAGHGRISRPPAKPASRLSAWTRWTIGCQAKSTLSFDDPLPLLRAT